jgi:hypothetical protein
MIADIFCILTIYSYSAVIRRIAHIFPGNAAYLCATYRYSPVKYRIIAYRDDIVICSNGDYYLYYCRIYNELYMIYNSRDKIFINIRRNRIISYIDINRELIIDLYNNGNMHKIIYKMPDNMHKMREYSRNGAIICDSICAISIIEYENRIYINIKDYGRKIIYDADNRVIEIYHKYNNRIKGSYWIFDRANNAPRYYRL